MGRKRTTALPRGIQERPLANGRMSYRINFRDQNGKRWQETAPSLREAKRLLAQRHREVQEGTFVPRGRGATSATTLASFADDYFAAKASSGRSRSIEDDQTRFRLHVSPSLGEMRIGDIRPQHVHELLLQLHAGHLSAKSVRNVHGVLNAMLEQARFKDLLVDNPARLPRGKLPRVAKKTKPMFTRQELQTLVTDPRIAEHRRVFYALQGLAGMRLGEASGRRWRDVDFYAPGLSSIRVATQYEDAPLKTADEAEDTRERLVPIHPFLREILIAWWGVGFERTYGAPPNGEHDWLCADPRTGLPRSQNQAIKALYRDLAKVGIKHRTGETDRGRSCHAFRHSFISLARSDGAQKAALETVTHNAKGDVMDGYTQYLWPATCQAVGSLKMPCDVPDEDQKEPDRTAGGSRPFRAPPVAPQGPALGPTDTVDPGIYSGGGGSRTRVRKSSATLASTCVVRDQFSPRRCPRTGSSLG